LFAGQISKIKFRLGPHIWTNLIKYLPSRICFDNLHLIPTFWWLFWIEMDGNLVYETFFKRSKGRTLAMLGINECLVYSLVLSLLIIVSLSLSAVARSDAINTISRNSCIMRQVCVLTSLDVNSSLAFNNNMKGLHYRGLKYWITCDNIATKIHSQVTCIHWHIINVTTLIR